MATVMVTDTDMDMVTADTAMVAMAMATKRTKKARNAIVVISIMMRINSGSR